MAKAFSFTYSKLKSFETCGRQHKAQLDKLPGMEPSGDAIDYGNRVHKALAEALRTYDAPITLPNQMKYLQYWVNYVNSLPGQKYIEDKWAMDRTFQPILFFSNQAWLRLIVDVAVVGDKVGWLLDWKTGKRLEEPLQLWLGAAIMFAKFPQLELIDSMFCWLKEDDGKNSHECITAETIKRNQIGEVWNSILPRVSAYENAIDTNTFLPSPGRHCRYCKLQSCEFFGKAQ